MVFHASWRPNVFGPAVVTRGDIGMSSLYETEKADVVFRAFSVEKPASTDESILLDSSINFAIARTTLVHRQALLRRATRPAHRRAAFLDDVAGVGVAVLVALRPAPWIV